MSARGYQDWKPNADTTYWVLRTKDVLEAYRKHWPLSVRQVFYRLVAEHGYEKSEAGYGKLTQIISKARRAGYLPWEAIRDGGLGRSIGANYFEGADDFQETIRGAARAMKLDRQRGQDKVIEFWCEAGGMVPILTAIAEPYSARVNTGGGYDSVTAKHNLAVRVMDRARKGRTTLILHVGDFDGSGEDMCNVLREDAGLMVVTQIASSMRRTYERGDRSWMHVTGSIWDFFETGEMTEEFDDFLERQFKVERVALTGRQVVDRNVITAPAKKTDSRTEAFLARNWEIVEELGTREISAQLEALTPDDLEELFREVIEGHMDMDVYEEVLEEEEEVRAELMRRLG